MIPDLTKLDEWTVPRELWIRTEWTDNNDEASRESLLGLIQLCKKAGWRSVHSTGTGDSLKLTRH